MAMRNKSSGFLSFLLFFILCSCFLLTSSLTAYSLYSQSGTEALYPRKMIDQALHDMAELLYAEEPLDQSVQQDLYYNLKYVVEENNIYYNSANDLKLTYDQFLESLADEGRLVVSWEQGQMPQVRYNGSYFLIDKKTITSDIAEQCVSILQLYTQDQVQRAAFVINESLAYNTPMYYSYAFFEESMNNLKICFYSSLCLFFVSMALVFLRWRQIAAFNESMAHYARWLWMEFKLILTLIILLLCSSGLPLPVAVIALFWLGYLWINELHFNGLSLFSHNSVSSLLSYIRRISGTYGYQRRWLSEFLLLVAVEVICAFMLWSMMFSSFLGLGGILAFILIFGLAVILLFLYIRKMMNFMQDATELSKQVENIRRGRLKEQVMLSEGSLLEPVSEHLEKIKEGVSHQVEEQLKSEKLKIELITNVSHDLKTPITSLINYSDLLMKAEITPEYARDYVRIISQKSIRLKNLVQDLFEISKAASGNLQLDFQTLEVNGLLMQTLAELEEKMAASTLEFKVQYLEGPGFIMGDGSRLYNVFDNLISNAIKYSLENTRVYIKVEREADQLVISFKNIANYELTFDPGTLTERFVRGDVSRSTEGSGLGLAIAETFVNLMRGTMEVSADGDLFKIELRFQEIVPENEKAE